MGLQDHHLLRRVPTGRRCYRSVTSLQITRQFTHALLVELTAPNWGAFTAGRVIAYIGVSDAGYQARFAPILLQVGLVQNASPGYCSEVSPSQLRGFMNGTMTVIATIGNVIGVGVSVPYVQEVRRIGWIVSCRMVIRNLPF